MLAARADDVPRWRWVRWAGGCEAKAFWAWDDPLPLAGALEKLEWAAGRAPMATNPGVASLYIVNPLRGGGMLQLFSTSQFFSDLLIANPDFLEMLRIPLRSSPSRAELLDLCLQAGDVVE